MLFVDCSYRQKPCSPSAVTEGQVGCVTKSWARSAVWKILKAHQFHPTRAPIDASCPLPQFTFSVDESLRRDRRIMTLSKFHLCEVVAGREETI